jgi:transposase-like protein
MDMDHSEVLEKQGDPGKISAVAKIRRCSAPWRAGAPKMKKGHGSKFGRKKEAAIAALLSGKSQAEAARVAGVDPSTLKRWMRLPEFQAEYLEVRREAMSQANARIQQNSGALASLGFKLVADPATPASVRAHLILGLLDRGNKALELEDVLLRVAALERAAEETNRGGRR